MLLAEEYCCPPPADTPCDVCANGITVDPSVPVGEGSSKTCGDLAIDSKVVEDGSDVCDQMRLTELVCCPALPDAPCSVCPGGVENPNRVVSGKTCDEIASDASLIEDTSDLCVQLLEAESACCPSSLSNTTSPTISPALNDTAMFESCPVCPDGITVPADTSIGGDGKTCGILIEDALTTSSDDVGCQLMKEEELTCCPSKAENPCPVCPDGISVDATTSVGSAGKTCADLLIDRENTEDASDTCTGMFEVAAPVCCPSTPTISPSSGGINETKTESEIVDGNSTISPTTTPTDDSTTLGDVVTPSPTIASSSNVTYEPTVIEEEEGEGPPSPSLTFETEPAAPVTSDSSSRSSCAVVVAVVSAIGAVAYVV
jgi:hypothetical protein